MTKYYEVEGTATVIFSEIVEASSHDKAVQEAKKTLHAFGHDVVDLKVHHIETLDRFDFSED